MLVYAGLKKRSNQPNHFKSNRNTIRLISLLHFMLVTPACPSLSNWTLLEVYYVGVEAGMGWFMASKTS